MESNIISINEIYIKQYLDLLFNEFDEENLKRIHLGIKKALLLNREWYGIENTKNIINKFSLDEMGFLVE